LDIYFVLRRIGALYFIEVNDAGTKHDLSITSLKDIVASAICQINVLEAAATRRLMIITGHFIPVQAIQVFSNYYNVWDPTYPWCLCLEKKT